MQSKLTTPVLLGIVATIGFNLLPIIFGIGMAMNVCFVAYAALMLLLSYGDRRVLGYAAVLTACNLANGETLLSFSFLMAVLAIVKEFLGLGQAIRKLKAHRWWYLYLVAFLLIGLSAIVWITDLRMAATEGKRALSYLGYLVVLPLAVGLTIRTLQDGIRVVSLLSLMSVALLGWFYFLGKSGIEINPSLNVTDETLVVYRQIGQAFLNFNRTQVCIVLAALAVGSLPLTVDISLNFRAAPFYFASGVCFFMIVQLASIASAFAMVCGMAVVFWGSITTSRSLRRILFALLIFSLVGGVIYLAAFQIETALSTRVYEKAATGGIDRREFWEAGIKYILDAPFGGGWILTMQENSGHSDFLIFLSSYGWLTGLLYIAATGRLFLSLLRVLIRQRDTIPQSRILLLVGMASITVYTVNSILDMLSANIGYFQTVWALILTSATTVAVTGAAKVGTYRSDGSTG
jgi:hypothetical protein